MRRPSGNTTTDDPSDQGSMPASVPGGSLRRWRDTPPEHTVLMSTNATAAAEQLPLLDLPAPAPRRVIQLRRRVPARLRLDEQTRRVGLAGVAEAMAILAAQAERRAQQTDGRRVITKQAA